MFKSVYALICGAMLFVSSTGYAGKVYFCNATNTKVQLVKAFKNPAGQWVTEGWYGIESNKCTSGEFEGDGYYYAKDITNVQYWSWTGGADDKNFCVNNSTDPLINADQTCTNSAVQQTFRKIVTSSNTDNNSVILGNADSSRSFGYCNNFSEKIWTTVAWEQGKGIKSRGWWGVEPTKCVSFWVPFATESAFVYAYNSNSTHVWNGNPDNSFVMCINKTDAFDLVDSNLIACNAENQALKAFLRVSAKEQFKFTAENAAVRP